MTEDDLEFHAWPLRSVGGQHVGPIGYGALVVHKPTGIAVACESERSQLRNKQKAMEKLRQLLGMERLVEAASRYTKHSRAMRTIAQYDGSTLKVAIEVDRAHNDIMTAIDALSGSPSGGEG